MELELIRQADPAVAEAIGLELNRQRTHVELIASENFVSPAVMAAMGTCLTNKYAEGYPGKRYYGGCEYVDIIEDLARKRACELFGADHANVQPHSCAQANLAVYFAMLKPGDTVMGMGLSNGGHLTHGSPVNMSGSFFRFVPYGVSSETEMIDYDEVRRLAKENSPKMIVAGASAYPRVIDFRKLREIADEAGAQCVEEHARLKSVVEYQLEVLLRVVVRAERVERRVILDAPCRPRGDLMRAGRLQRPREELVRYRARHRRSRPLSRRRRGLRHRERRLRLHAPRHKAARARLHRHHRRDRGDAAATEGRREHLRATRPDAYRYDTQRRE